MFGFAIWSSIGSGRRESAQHKALAVVHGHLRTSYHLGRANHKLGDVTEAERLDQQAAETGDAEDPRLVGGRYLQGIGTERDIYTAAEWFRQAAAQGDARAAAELQQMIDDGLVVPGPAN